MDKKELLEKFDSLYAEAMGSGDKDDINVSMSVLKKAVKLLASADIESARELVDCYEGSLSYYNYLTEREASDILGKFVNYDGSKGAKWRDPDTVFRNVESLGGNTDNESHYNKWALFVTINMFASDHGAVIKKIVGDDPSKFFEVCYEFAVSQLSDRDRLSWIRDYFGLSCH